MIRALSTTTSVLRAEAEGDLKHTKERVIEDGAERDLKLPILKTGVMWP